MSSVSRPVSTLWAVSDLHAAVGKNRSRIAEIQPRDPSDWLIVAGDVAERTELVVQIMATLVDRFHTVVWVPGNHELYARGGDRYRGREKYFDLAARLRDIGVVTPEDPYPVFGGVTVVPMFTLYDYSFRDPAVSVGEALDQARARQVVLTDEVAIAPFVDVRAWCWERLAYTTRRMSRVEGPTILVNHWPLVKEATSALAFGDIALWCGTRHTRGWAQRYSARAVVYGHLHIPGVRTFSGVEHIEVSLGYPREWERQERFDVRPQWPYPVMEVEL